MNRVLDHDRGERESPVAVRVGEEERVAHATSGAPSASLAVTATAPSVSVASRMISSAVTTYW